MPKQSSMTISIKKKETLNQLKNFLGLTSRNPVKTHTRRYVNTWFKITVIQNS